MQPSCTWTFVPHECHILHKSMLQKNELYESLHMTVNTNLNVHENLHVKELKQMDFLHALLNFFLF